MTLRCEENERIRTLISTLLFDDDLDTSFTTTRTVQRAHASEMKWDENNVVYGWICGKFRFAEEKILSTWESLNYSGQETLTKLSDKEYRVEGSSLGRGESSSWDIVLTNSA
jgi:hypothetical protein